MPQDQAMLGATQVNGELEVGADQRFEEAWHRYEVVGRALLVLVAIAGLAGLLGSGPLSHRTVVAPSGLLAVDFEPIARFGTPTQITVHIRPRSGDGSPQTAELHIDSNFVEPMGLQGTLPVALAARAEGGGLTLIIAMAADRDAFVRLKARPTEMGPIPLTVSVDGGEPLRWTQYILP